MIVRACLGCDGLLPRVVETSWVVEHVHDLEADFLAVYGVDDMYVLPGVRWLRLAHRLPAYTSVVARLVAGSVGRSQEPGEVDGPVTSAEIAASQTLSDVISVGHS